MKMITSKDIFDLRNDKFNNDYHLELLSKMNEGDLSARWELVLAVVPLMKKKTGKFQSKWVKRDDMDDFVHTMYEILYHAAEKWKPEFGKWSYYSSLWSYEVCAKFARQRLVVRQDEKRGKIPGMKYVDGLEEYQRDALLSTEDSYSSIDLNRLLNNTSTLSEKEKSIIDSHIFQDEELSSISETLGVSRQRASQIYQRAIHKIRTSNMVEFS